MDITAWAAIVAKVGVAKINAELKNRGLMFTSSVPLEAANVLVSIAGKTQADVAAVVINLFGSGTTIELMTETLMAVFPKARISPRHGAHYISKARSGHLPNVFFDGIIPHAKPHRRVKDITLNAAKQTVEIVEQVASEVSISSLLKPKVEETEIMDPETEIMEPEPEVVEPEPIDLNKLSYAELQQMAKDRGIKYVSVKKAKLISDLENCK